jgi:hypothetical protein
MNWVQNMVSWALKMVTEALWQLQDLPRCYLLRNMHPGLWLDSPKTRPPKVTKHWCQKEVQNEEAHHPKNL